MYDILRYRCWDQAPFCVQSYDPLKALFTSLLVYGFPSRSYGAPSLVDVVLYFISPFIGPVVSSFRHFISISVVYRSACVVILYTWYIHRIPVARQAILSVLDVRYARHLSSGVIPSFGSPFTKFFVCSFRHSIPILLCASRYVASCFIGYR